MTAPFGEPVVPEVKITSAAPLEQRPWGGGCRRSLQLAADDENRAPVFVASASRVAGSVVA